MLPLENYRVRCMSMGFLMQVCHEKLPALDRRALLTILYRVPAACIG